MGGSLGRREATGRGVMIVDARSGASTSGFDIKGATVAVQGFGNVGSVSADLLARIGAKIVAVTDWKGGVYNANGPRHRRSCSTTRSSTRPIDGFPGGEPLDERAAVRARRRRARSRPRSKTRSRWRTRRRSSAKVVVEGRQRPDDAGRAQAPARARRLRHPRHPRQRRRRDDVVLRVGAGSPRLLLDRRRK